MYFMGSIIYRLRANRQNIPNLQVRNANPLARILPLLHLLQQFTEILKCHHTTRRQHYIALSYLEHQKASNLNTFQEGHCLNKRNQPRRSDVAVGLPEEAQRTRSFLHGE